MLLENKKGVILGVANQFSIAWGIAKKSYENGAKLYLSYLNDKLKKRVEPLANEVNAEIFELDVSNPDSVKRFFDELDKKNEKIDFLVHSIAFAKREDLGNNFINTSRDGFLTAMEISVYSLVEISKYIKQFMTESGSIITLTYIGSEKVIKSYNVMGVAKSALESSVRYLAEDLGPSGIRINAISAGPVNTLSARGISGFTSILKVVEEKAPLRRNVTVDEIANTALFLLSDLSSGITGEIIHVDCGFNIKGI